ncbi:hypothetical protein [Salinigranum sp. GCM10025319]|uniref:hypothetical protein n=1 Tax=Salinigranum sp. GCM10025319 TaxID=3252687 RepID=UPI00360FC0B6
MVSNDTHATGDRTRRDVLRTGTAAVATALTAGCTSALPPLGTRQRFGRVNVPPADDPTYRRWLPAPAALDGVDGSQYRVLLRRPTALDYPAPVRFTTPRKQLLAELDYVGVGYPNYDRLLRTPFGTVLEGGFEPATVAAALTESGYRRDGTYAGHDVFVRSDGPRRAVLTEGALVWSSRRVHARPNVAALVDAHEGRVPRFHEVDDAFERVTDAIGESRMVEYIPPQGERTWASAEGFRFDGRVAYHVRTFLYPEGETPPEDELRRRSKTGTVLTREVENTDFRVDGRLVTVEGRIPPDAGVQPSEVDPPYPPQVTWGYGRDRVAETVTLRHEAGERVPTDALGLAFTVDATDGQLVDSKARPLATDLDRLGPGNAVTVDLRDVPEVTVIRPEDVDHDSEESDHGADEPSANGDTRPATVLELQFGPDALGRTLFSIDLEDRA